MMEIKVIIQIKKEDDRGFWLTQLHDRENDEDQDFLV